MVFSLATLLPPAGERPSSLPQAFPHLMEALFAELGYVAHLLEEQAQGSLSARDLEDILHLIRISSEFRARLEQPLDQEPSPDGQVSSPAHRPTLSAPLPGAFHPQTPTSPLPPWYHQHCDTPVHPREPHRGSLHDHMPTSVSTAYHGHPPHIPPFTPPERTHRSRNDVGTPYSKPRSRAAVRRNPRLDSGTSKSWKGLLRLLPGVAKA